MIDSRNVASRSEIIRERLRKSIANLTEDGVLHETAIPGLSLFQHQECRSKVLTKYEPSICLLVQGSKRVTLDDESFVYDPGHFLITSVSLPATVQINQASKQSPLLGLSLKLDRRKLSELMVDAGLPSPDKRKTSRAMATGKVDLSLFSALERLIELLNEEKDIPILAPLIKKEIMYRLLVGEKGMRFREIALTGSRSHNIAETIDWINDHYKQKDISVDSLARQARMSNSTFHKHFREVTGLSPLQYIKSLRLHEARHLMLTEEKDATRASYAVGYGSPSQFSREYKRKFGEPPLTDVQQLRGRSVATP